MIKSLFYILLLTVLVFQQACQNQKPPEVVSDNGREVREIARLQACAKTDFNDHLLEFDNVKSLFECTKWNKLFPDFYKGITGIGKKDWEHLFSPFNNEFFKNKFRRDRMILEIKALDKKGGLDDLSRVLNALNETNFYDSFNSLYKCEKNPELPDCKRRDLTHLSRADIKKFLTLLDVRPEEYHSFSKLLVEFSKALKDDQDVFRDAVKKFFYTDEFSDFRVDLVSALLSKHKKDENDLEWKFYSSLLMKTDEGKNPFFYTWLNKTITENDFVSLAMTGSRNGTYPNLLQDVKTIKMNLELPLVCSDPNNTFNLETDINTHLTDFSRRIYASSYRDSVSFLIQSQTEIKIAESFCPSLTELKGGDEEVTKFHDILHNFKFLIDSPGKFTLFKFLVSINFEDDPNYLIEFSNSNIFKSLIKLTGIVGEHSNDYFKILFRVLKRLDVDSFRSLGVLSQYIYSDEKPGRLKAISKYWNFLTFEEKNFLFKFIDRHLDEDTNFVNLFEFYSKVILEMIEVGPVLAKSYLGEESDKTMDALEVLASQFSGKKALADFSRFFSRDHVINIIKIVTQGTVIREESIRRLNLIYSPDYFDNLSRGVYEIEYVSSTTNTNDLHKCLNDFGNTENIYLGISKLPSSCANISSEELTLNFLQWGNEFDSFWKEVSGSSTASFWDKYGIMSPGLLNSNVGLIKILDQKLSGSDKNEGGGIQYLVLTLKEHFLRSSVASTLRKLPKSFSKFIYELGKGNSAKELRTKLVRYIADPQSADPVSDYLKRLSDVFNDYGSELDSGFEEKLVDTLKAYKTPVHLECENYSNLNIGGYPCPTREMTKAISYKVLKDLGSVYEKGKSSAATELVKSISSVGGLMIPFKEKEENQTKYRLTLKESINMMFTLSDKEDENNTKPMLYAKSHASDKNYIFRIEEDFSIDGGSNQRPWKESHFNIKKKVKRIDEVLTSMERVEVVMRDIHLDEGYLGVHYMNSVAKAYDYDTVLKKKLRMFKMCAGLKFCGKFMNRDQRRLVKNSIESYPVLQEVNQYKDWKYGNYMMTLLGGIVRSSQKSSQTTAIVKAKLFGKVFEVPFVQTKKQLQKHNGKILMKVSMLGAFNNISRFIRSRVGESREEIDEFLSKESLTNTDDNFLKVNDWQSFDKKINPFIKNLNNSKMKDGGTIVSNFVDYLYDSTDLENKVIEDFVMQAMILSGYIGVPKQYSSNKNIQHFNEIDTGFLVKLANSIIPIIPTLEPIFKSREVFSDLILEATKFLNFFNKGLVSEEAPGKYYFVLNQSLNAIKTFTDENPETFDFIDTKARSESFAKASYSFVDDGWAYFEFLKEHNNGPSGLSILGKNVSKFLDDDRLNLKKVRDYLMFTTRPDICDGDEARCVPNHHYDEIFKVVEVFSKPEDNPRISVWTINFFEKHANNVIDFINFIFPSVKIL